MGARYFTGPMALQTPPHFLLEIPREPSQNGYNRQISSYTPEPSHLISILIIQSTNLQFLILLSTIYNFFTPKSSSTIYKKNYPFGLHSTLKVLAESTIYIKALHHPRELKDTWHFLVYGIWDPPIMALK